ISFADATQCGDGTIYRASGFVLTMIKHDHNTAIDQDGNAHHKMKYESNPVSTGYTDVTGGKNDWGKFVREMGWEHAVGYQLRYIYFLDPSYRARLTVDEIPYERIAEMGARMYRG